ncbi:MAG: hypothetical protein AMJ92_02495 [candidate division Zixibacteria bacterium SM23_81]|nr:MAG: hypothetical protein AMJ92_02495 [candidate division Zixibacteria bacterium SM23_81]
MKTISILGAIFAAMVIMNCQPPVDIEAEKVTIRGVLDNYITSIENEDMELYGQNMSHDADMVNFGAFGDPIVGWEALETLITGQNEALSQTKITARDVSIQVAPSGNLAWATSLWNFNAMIGEDPVEWPVRCTWVLEKRNNVWVIIHFHKSIAAG